ncbi:hypothetical protein STENM223S_10439 [Streptomyces tendae]
MPGSRRAAAGHGRGVHAHRGPAAMRLLGRTTWYAPSVLRRFHGRSGLSEGGPAPAAPAPAPSAEPAEVKDTTGV